MAGCFGPFTKKFGSGAVNILQARVVLANGSLVTASKCSHPDLFYSIRGGGGGLAGVVTEFVARSHPFPRHTSSAQVSVSAKTRAECTAGLAAALQTLAATGLNGTAGTLCDNGGLSWDCGEAGGSAAVHCQAYEGEPAAMQAQLQPLADWARAQGGTMRSSIGSRRASPPAPLLAPRPSSVRGAAGSRGTRPPSTLQTRPAACRPGCCRSTQTARSRRRCSRRCQSTCPPATWPGRRTRRRWPRRSSR